MTANKYIVLVILFCFVCGMNFFLSGMQQKNPPFHSVEELRILRSHSTQAPIQPGEYFLHSLRCQPCHGYDTLGTANVDHNGNDINLYDDWHTSMMAFSARDPFWRAQVSHEILVNPAHALALQDKCTSCHAPMGHFTANYLGAAHYTINDLNNDSLGLDGVSCTGCHEIGTQNLGNVFSGEIPYDTTLKEFGPFRYPLIGPMQLYIGLVPTYSAHVSESRFCSPCHTLITNTVDLSGVPTGTTFLEQATYQEWQNSSFPADNVECQTCHMPQTLDSVVISNGILGLAPRSPFNLHKFMGGNAFMLKLIKSNKAALEIYADNKDFDSTIAATTTLLRKNTLDVNLSIENLTADTAFLMVELKNKAGHKFPSGYPSRRAVVQLIGLDQNNDTIFKSGIFNQNFEVNGINPFFEPHHNVISSSNVSQIYEIVMGDVNQNKTTLLARGSSALKDNRIPPEGFLSTHPNYDTVAIVGEAATDPDFNKTSGGVEGTGKDLIHYHIPLAGLNGRVSFFARIYYQSVPPQFVQPMFAFSSAAIDTFKRMFQSADQTPLLVGVDSLTNINVSIAENEAVNDLQLFPNITGDGKIKIISLYPVDKMEVFNSGGHLILFKNLSPFRTAENLTLPAAPGIYFIRLFSHDKEFIRKVVRL